MPEHPTSGGEFRSAAEQFAIQKVNECGPEFASSHPQITEDASTMSLKEIARKYKVADMFGVTEEIATNIVKKALHQLVPPEERNTLYEPRLSQARRDAGLRSLEKGKGIFGMSDAKRIEARKRASSVARERGVGIFGMSKEELQQAGEKSQETTRKNEWFGGKIIDGMDEGTFAKHLASLTEYQLSTGPFVGSPDYTKIMTEVNARYGKSRSRAATKGFFENEKTRNKD